jgi:hypothetical protein
MALRSLMMKNVKAINTNKKFYNDQMVGHLKGVIEGVENGDIDAIAIIGVCGLDIITTGVIGMAPPIVMIGAIETLKMQTAAEAAMENMGVEE